MDWLGNILNLSVVLWLIATVVTDLRIRRVRNWMVVLGLVAGAVVLLSGLQPFHLQVSLTNGLLGMVVAFCALMPFYAMRWMGAGDVKFAAVIGLWFGLQTDLLTIWVGGSLLAGIHGLAVIFWRKFQQRPEWTWLQARFLFLQRYTPASPLPAEQPSASADTGTAPARRSGPARSIPYAGYMAIIAIWLLLQG